MLGYVVEKAAFFSPMVGGWKGLGEQATIGSDKGEGLKLKA